jgi:hypothetical protein
MVSRLFTKGASGVAKKLLKNPSAGSGSSTGRAGQGLVSPRARNKVALEKKVNNNTASKTEIAKLKKLEAADKADTLRARVKADEARRKQKGVMPTKPKKPKDAVATYMKTGEILEGFTPTPKQVAQRKRNVAARRATNKKAGGKIVYRKKPGQVLKGNQKKLDVNNDGKITKKDFDTINAKPKDKPTPPIGKGAVERGNRMSEMEADSAKAMNKKMGGGQVMKYKKGGMVYKKHGGVVKAASGGDSLIASCYD